MTNTQRNEEMWNRLGAEREKGSEGGGESERERKRVNEMKMETFKIKSFHHHPF